MKTNLLKTLTISSCCVLLTACGAIFDTDNTQPPTPLTNFNSEIHILQSWGKSPNTGAGDNKHDYLRLAIASNCNSVFTASKVGMVSAADKATGNTRWSTPTGVEITAGPGAAEGLVFVGGANGEVVALKQDTGKIVWKALVSNEVLATPVASNGIVVVKPVDGHIYGLSTCDGHMIWTYQQTEPLLILRASSSPAIVDNAALIGFANGNLAKVSLMEGNLHWQQPMAIAQGTFAVQRMIDIDADPIIYNRNVYVATYQGQISSIDLSSGKPLWSHEISSYTGIAADADKVYVSDAQGQVWAFDSHTGSVVWHQCQLTARGVTAPAIMGCYVVVGDAEGYLHWLSKQDGHFVGRTKMSNSGILAAPIVDQGVLYAVTRSGYLTAYTIR